MSSRRGVILVVVLILFGVAISAAAVLVLALVAGAPTPAPSNATLYLKLHAPFSEQEPSELLGRLLPQPPTLRDTLDAIRKAKGDSRIRTLVVLPQAQGALWAQVQEVRAALEDFKTTGKPLTAYLESAGIAEYYLASAADRVVMMPAGQLDVTGLAFYELFFRGTLDKVGVYPDLLHIGDYKTAANTFTAKGLTPAHREMLESLNGDWYAEIVRAVARGRKVTEAVARRALDGGPYLAEAAKAAGLVDDLAYEDQLDDTAPIQGTNRLEGERYAKVAVPIPAAERSVGSKIALLYAVGTIASGRSSFDSPSGVVLGSETFVEWIRKVRVDPEIRAVVVRIDSPGGSAVASEVIWRELMLTRDVKPVVVSMGDVAASGGYYIAAPAAAIVAEPGTLTGSIGIVTGKFVVSGALEKLGIGAQSVSTGPLAETSSPFRPFSTEERRRIEEQMQATYELFLRRVAEGRGQTTEKIDAVGQGRVWTGRQARELGLIDELGGLDDAIRIAKQRARLDPARRVDLVVYPAKRSIYEVLWNPLGSADASGVGAWFRQPDARMLARALSTLQLFRRGEPLAVMPNLFWR